MSRGWVITGWACGLLPALLCAAVHVARPPVPLAIELPQRPALAFEQYLVDLGPVQPTSEVRGHFVFRNRGTAPVVVTAIEPSCGCLQPLISKADRQFAPGETGRLVLRMQPANEAPGPKDYTAVVKYSDPEPREVRLSFRLELPTRQMTVRPRALLVYQHSDQSTVHELIVADSRAQPAKITGTSINSPWITVEPNGERVTADGVHETLFRITVAGTVPSGKHDAVVVFQTTDPLSPVLKVPVILQGRPADWKADSAKTASPLTPNPSPVDSPRDSSSSVSDTP